MFSFFQSKDNNKKEEEENEKSDVVLVDVEKVDLSQSHSSHRSSTPSSRSPQKVSSVQAQSSPYTQNNQTDQRIQRLGNIGVEVNIETVPQGQADQELIHSPSKIKKSSRRDQTDKKELKELEGKRRLSRSSSRRRRGRNPPREKKTVKRKEKSNSPEKTKKEKKSKKKKKKRSKTVTESSVFESQVSRSKFESSRYSPRSDSEGSEGSYDDQDSQSSGSSRSDSEGYSSQSDSLDERDHLINKYRLIKPNNSSACFFHLVFKILGAFCYMFLGFILNSDMNVFLSIFACILLDFWITKNITGRYLVGMRWWSYVGRDNQTHYEYESFDYEINYSPLDITIFWWGIFINVMFWSILLVINTFAINPLFGLLTFIAFTLNGMNLYGYYNCRKNHQRKVDRFLGKMRRNLGQQLIERLI